MKIKAYEVMRLAAENPQKYAGKKYEVAEGVALNFRGTMYGEIKIGADGQMVMECSSIFISNNTVLKEIEQPVSFMEAIEAYHSGKMIRCEVKTINGNTRRFIYVPAPAIPCDLGFALKTKELSTISSGEILNGVWYIRD